MPVYKFRSLADARSALWGDPDDPKLPVRIRNWWGYCANLMAVESPRGLRKFRTIEEANAERETWRVETFFKPVTGDPPAGA